MKKFQKNNLNKKDHEKVDKCAKIVKKSIDVLGVASFCVLTVVKFVPKAIKKIKKL